MSKTTKSLLIILAIGLAAYFYINSDSYINKKPINDSDIVGTWEFSYGDSGSLHFMENGSIESNSGFFHGSWKVLSSDERYVQVSFDMSEAEYEMALQELYIAWMSDEELYENGLLPYEDMKEGVWESYSLPEDALVFRYIRSDNRMVAIDDDDCVLRKN